MAGILGPVEVVEGIAIGTGVGQAIGDVVTPKLQGFKNERWTKYPDRPLDPGQAALAAIKGFPTALKLAEEAAKSGYGGDVFGVLVQNLRQHPGFADALRLWRRGYATWQDVYDYLQRAGYADAIIKQFIGPSANDPHLKNERLAPAQIALGIVRSIIADPGLMPVNLNTAGGVVPAYPVSTIDALTEAEANGITRERLRVLVGEIGLPMSTQQAASALFRHIIEKPDYYRSILEGDVRPEWADAILEQARQILTPGQYAELQLRGFLTATERRTNTAKHGMSQADSDLLFNVLGRSINVHQIVTGEARGGTYKPPPDTLAQQEAGIPPAFLASLQRGNLRPEYYDLAYANRYTYPSFFAIRGLLTGGVLSADEGYQILLEMGWKPELARKVANFYGAATGAIKPDPWVAKAETQLWGTTHRSFIASESDEADATPRFTAMNISPDAQTYILELWREERALIRKQLTPAQIKKAYEKLSKNYATGVAWTRDDALAALVSRGYSVTEANDYLDIPSGK